MVQALWGKVYSVTLLCGEGMHALNALFCGVRTYMQYLHAEPFVKEMSRALARSRPGFFLPKLSLAQAKTSSVTKGGCLRSMVQKRLFLLVTTQDSASTSPPHHKPSRGGMT